MEAVHGSEGWLPHQNEDPCLPDLPGCEDLPLSSIAFHISLEVILLSICVFGIGLRANAHAELGESQNKIKSV